MKTKEMKINDMWSKPNPTTRKNSKPDRTIPDESINVRDLINKHLSGNMPDGAQNMQFSGDGVVTPYVDLSEVHAQSRKAEELIQAYNKQQRDIEAGKLKKRQLDYESNLKKQWEEEQAKSAQQ